MIIFNKKLKYKTEKRLQFIDLTDEVKKIVKDSKVNEGQATVFSPHTTCAVKINEKEACFIKDFSDFIDSLIPSDKYFRHDDLKIRTENLACATGEGECLNGHSHVKQMFVGSASECVPIIKGELALGQWQWIFLIELDQARDREVLVQVIGE